MTQKNGYLRLWTDKWTGVTSDIRGPWPVGMTVCYDLRFPELYSKLRYDMVGRLQVDLAFTPDRPR